MAKNYGFKSPGWDAGIVAQNAEYLANNEYEKLANYYYSRNPNNILITVFLSIFFRLANLLKFINGYSLILLFNCMIFSFTGYILYKTSVKLLPKKYAIFTYIAYLFLIGFSPWVVIHYSDQAGLWIVSLCFYLYLKIKEAEKLNHKLIYIFLFSLFETIGYYVKPQIFILFIAAIVCEIIANAKKKISFEDVKKICVGLLAIAIAIVTVKLVHSNSGFEIDNERRFGFTHYLMMGFNEETSGVFSIKDLVLSENCDTYAQRYSANITEFKNRVKNLGISGILKLFGRKMIINYGDGTFAWGGEGGFFGEEFTVENSIIKDKLKALYWTDGEYYKIFKTSMQSIWIAILFFDIFAFMKLRDKNEIQVMKIAIIGLTIFELLFEARARYLFLYVPFYILLAVIGFKNIVNCFNKKLGNGEK